MQPRARGIRTISAALNLTGRTLAAEEFYNSKTGITPL